MRALLLISAASVALAQCYLATNQTACSAMTNCTFLAGGCGCTSLALNTTSCAMCVGTTCSSSTTNDTCSTKSECSWRPDICYDTPAPPTPMMATPCSATNKADCVNNGACFWVSVSQTVCGQAMTHDLCLPCEAVDVATRSAITNLKGQTCTWPKMGGYAQDFKATLNDAAQGSNVTACSALLPASAGDSAILSLPFARAFFQNAYEPTSVATCEAAKNSAAAMAPGVAFLIVAALM